MAAGGHFCLMDNEGTNNGLMNTLDGSQEPYMTFIVRDMKKYIACENDSCRHIGFLNYVIV